MIENGEGNVRLIDANALKEKWLFRGKDGKPYRDEIDNAPTIEPKILDDGTLVVKVKDGSKVGRVLVEGENHFGGLYYAETEPKVDKDYLIELIQGAVYDGEDCARLMKMVESKQGEWIPCSERLPEEHEWVGTKKFGTTISDKVHITFDVNGERFVKTLSLQNGELSNYEKQSMDAFYKGWKMLAWMPLPEPWEGADDE